MDSETAALLSRKLRVASFWSAQSVSVATTIGIIVVLLAEAVLFFQDVPSPIFSSEPPGQRFSRANNRSSAFFRWFRRP